MVLEGVLYHLESDKTLRVVPPECDRKQLFDEVHGGVFGGHFRGAKIHGILSKRYWWPRMRKDIVMWCQSCLVCASREVGRSSRPPLTPIPVGGPFDRVGVDVLHFPKSKSGNQYVVVFMDYLTKWPEAFATKDQTALTIAQLFIKHVVCRHGVPNQLLSDRGAAFLSQLMQEVCKVLGVKKINTTAYHPQTDGLVERFNRTLTSMLSKRVERNGSDWDIHLPFTLFAYRTAVQESTKESPFFLLYGRDAKLPTVVTDPSCEPREDLDLDTYRGELMYNLMDAWDLARKHIGKAQKAQKRTYDKHSKEPTAKLGDRVFVYMPQDKSTKAYKFARPFHGPYRVKKVLGTGVVVCPVNKPDLESIRVAWNQVRPCSSSIPTDEFWSGKKKVHVMPMRKKSTPKLTVEQPLKVWEGRLRSKKSSEDVLPKSGDM